MVTETAAVVVVCHHIFMKQLQLPSQESWGWGKSRHRSMEGLFVGWRTPDWETPQPHLEMSGYPNRVGAGGMMFASPSGPSPDSSKGKIAASCSAVVVLGSRAKAPPRLQSSPLPPIAELHPAPRGVHLSAIFLAHVKGICTWKSILHPSTTFVQTQVDISIGIVTSTLKQHRNHGAGP